jgi:hypothetical protein
MYTNNHPFDVRHIAPTLMEDSVGIMDRNRI